MQYQWDKNRHLLALQLPPCEVGSDAVPPAPQGSAGQALAIPVPFLLPLTSAGLRRQQPHCTLRPCLGFFPWQMWIQTQAQSSHSYPTKPTAMSLSLQTPVSKLHPWGPTRPLSLENSTEGMHTCPMLPLTPLCWGEDWGGLDFVPASPTAACRPGHPPHFDFGHPLTHCGVARAWTLLLHR